MRNVLILLLSFFVSSLPAQNNQNFWQSANEALINVSESDRIIVPDSYHTFGLDVAALKNYLKDAPVEFSEEAREHSFLLDLPMPDGAMETFAISDSPVMMPGLAAKYSQIKSYVGHSLLEKGKKLRFTLSQLGFHAAIHSPTSGTIYIDPYAENITDYYITYYTKDHHSTIPAEHLTCGNNEIPGLSNSTNTSPAPSATTTNASTRGPADLVDMKVYRLAVSTTGEWGNDQGTVESAMALIVIGVSRLNQIFEIDLGLRVILVNNNDQLIFMNGASDPFPNSGSGSNMISVNTNAINNIIGGGSYDIGHLFSKACDTGGVAFLESICTNTKAGAVTCQYNGSWEYTITRITAHEMGHCLGANHTWNFCGEIGNGNIAPGTAYEPGSGNSIMSYNGVCGNDPFVTSGPHDYYHVASLQEIYTHLSSTSIEDCPVITPTDNHFPTIELPYTNGFYIPVSTPFKLTAEGADEDGDELTYTWEQYNLDPNTTEMGSPVGNEPSFRSYAPGISPTRVFPKIETIVNNALDPREVLPYYTRNLKFRCTVRDNNPEIGVAVWEEMSFQVSDQAGPFVVTNPNNTLALWEVGDYVEVKWSVANTDNSPVNCKYVNIKLSTDGGYTYPVTLAENAPNDGTHFVVVPDQVSTTARVMVEAAGNIFFDISNANFEIVPPSAPGYTFDATPYVQQVCLPEAAAIDLPMFSLLNFNDPVNFTVTGLPVGAVASFSNNPAMPATGSQLTIDMTAVGDITDSYEVIIEGIAPDVDTHYRSVFLDLVSNDFSALGLVGPSNGEQGLDQSPMFSWSPSGNADYYEIQIATNPSFDEAFIVDEESNLTLTDYLSSVLLEKGTPYFWRVRPVNICGPGPYTNISAFHTEAFACSNYVSENVPIVISSNGTPTIESIIDVEQGGQISDLNVTKIKGSHNLVKHIKVSLRSPAGNLVQLFSGICPGSNSSLFNLGIDSQAPGPINCPPISGLPFLPQPVDALSNFTGEDSEGIWTLLVEVINSSGSGGVLEEWELEICGNAIVAAPYIVNNNVLLVPPGAFNYVLIDQLFSDDDDNTPGQLKYTLVEKSQNGNLNYNGNLLEVGGTFTQATINVGNLRYEHNPGAGLTDEFTFTVSDGNGGWIGPTVFQIEMDENAMVGTSDPFAGNELLVYPNPTKDVLYVKLATPVNATIEARLYNLQGQLITTQAAKNGMDVLRFETAPLSAGLYFVEVVLGGQALTQKVAVYK